MSMNLGEMVQSLNATLDRAKSTEREKSIDRQKSSRQKSIPIPGQVRRDDFNEDFVFGSSTAAFQIEGSAMDGGRGLSIWDAYTLHTPGLIEDGSNGNVSAQHYLYFDEDIKSMKKTGLDAYRFSISWSRILPGGKLCTGVNKEGIKFYSDLIDGIIAAGMEPYVTLFHWDLPYTLELEYGGFLSKNIVQDFLHLAEPCAFGNLEIVRIDSQLKLLIN